MDSKNTTATAARMKRGIALYRTHSAAIVRVAPFTYTVPACSGDHTYTVMLDLDFCTCPDHERAKALDTACKHRVAATIAAAKGRRQRVRATVKAG